MAGIVTALFLGLDSRKRRWVNYAGLGISSLYLLTGFALKWHVNEVFEENYSREEITADRYMTTPAPLSIFLWTGYAMSGDTLYAGLYSVFDGDRRVELYEIPQRSKLIAPYRDDLAVERLVWFSNGYYSVAQDSGGLFFSDIRFGRSDLWLTGEEAPFVWRYRLEFNRDSTEVTGFRHLEPSFLARSNLFGELVRRILGYRDRSSRAGSILGSP